MTIRFQLNGRPVEASADPNTTLLGWLRERGLTGSKEGCAEGECGACAVVLVREGSDGKTRYTPVNGCLMLLASCADQEIVTVEGIANVGEIGHGGADAVRGAGRFQHTRTEGRRPGVNGALHPVQEAMIRLGGSQCGYCTPGFVVSLFAEYYRDGRAESGFDLESIGGNLCRCTGYRPIRDAGRGLPMVSDGDPHAARLARPAPSSSSVQLESGARRFFRPTTLKEALEVLARHPDAKLVTGGTDLVVELNQRLVRYDVILSLEAVEELRGWDDADDALIIGAAVPLTEIEERLDGALPILTEELFPLFSSRLIRNRATLGGNLGNASPIGDSPPALLALGAEVVIASAKGERTLPLDQLFTGYRKTALEPGELIAKVRIPKPYPSIARFFKVSKRVHDDISTVAAGFALDLDGDNVIKGARLAYGGVAATPARATEAEKALLGKKWSRAALDAAIAKATGAFTPMTDQRGSARYRQAMVTSLLEKLWAEEGATS